MYVWLRFNFVNFGIGVRARLGCGELSFVVAEMVAAWRHSQVATATISKVIGNDRYGGTPEHVQVVLMKM